MSKGALKWMLLTLGRGQRANINGFEMSKGGCRLALMLDAEKNERVREVVDRLLQRSQKNALNYLAAQLDVGKPNFHDSKAEFQYELKSVQKAYDSLHVAFDTIVPKSDDEETFHNEMVERLREYLDRKSRQSADGKIPDSTSQLIRKNIAETGFLINSTWAVLDLMIALGDRLKELIDQEKEFWSLRHRAPNYYARAIALRLARLYANETRKKPTFGTARDGGYPSTEFGRALEEIYRILEVRANVRRAAEWAINELTEEDLSPPPTGLLGSMLRSPPLEDLTGKKPVNYLSQIGRELSKEKKK